MIPTIPTSSFSIDHGKAYLIIEATEVNRYAEVNLGRACSTCDGRGWVEAASHHPGCDGVYCEQMCPIQVQDSCPNCDGTGRHTFIVEVVDQSAPDRITSKSFRVHVVQTLKIYANWDWDGTGHPCVVQHTEGFGIHWLELDRPVTPVMLGSDAAPGKYVVILEGHNALN